MASRKGQMFVVTTIFLIGLIFVVQQILFQYLSVDPKASFLSNEFGVVKSLRDATNSTLQASQNCAQLVGNMEILKGFVDKSSATAGYAITLTYSINCDAWGNSPPNTAPLNTTIRVLGDKLDSTTKINFYK